MTALAGVLGAALDGDVGEGAPAGGVVLGVAKARHRAVELVRVPGYEDMGTIDFGCAP